MNTIILNTNRRGCGPSSPGDHPMSNFEFGGTLYRNSREMHAAIAEQWLTAGGLNNTADMYAALSEASDKQLADEAIEGWDTPKDPDADPNHRDFDRDELIAAFAELRENFQELYLDDDR